MSALYPVSPYQGPYNPRFVHRCAAGSFYIAAVPPRGQSIRQQCPACAQAFDVSQSHTGRVAMTPAPTMTPPSAEGTEP